MGTNSSKISEHLIAQWWYADRLPYPSKKKKIAICMAVHNSTIQRRLRRMEELGLITRRKRSSREKGQTTNFYDVTGLVNKATPLDMANLAAKEEGCPAKAPPGIDTHEVVASTPHRGGCSGDACPELLFGSFQPCRTVCPNHGLRFDADTNQDAFDTLANIFQPKLNRSMAKNDTILVDGIITQRVQDSFPTTDKGDVFEYFAFEQLLKDFDLSQEELDFGWVDGHNDGGIDGIYLFINGTLLTDSRTFSWPKSSAKIELYVVTAKHRDSFEIKPVESLCATAQEFFDLSVDNADLKASYSSAILKIRSLFHLAYERLASVCPSLAIRFIYASRGDASDIGENIRSRADQLSSIVSGLFSAGTVTFDFIGAAELVANYRRERSFSLALTVSEQLSSTESGYVVLAKIDDYANFVTDETGNLRRYLFDSNVRDYLGKSQVNLDIFASLVDQNAAEFWWLNNGVTILATSATPVGKKLLLDNIQIVNGLQTTETIFEYRKSPDFTPSNRCVLVKAIVSTEPAHRDQIIKATNNQNIVETAGLRASDKVQRDIEEYLERFGWYYERRKNYYKNIGKPAARFVTPLYLAAAFRAIVLKLPQTASKQKARFMRKDESYKQVFSEAVPIASYRFAVEVFKATETVLQDIERQTHRSFRFVATWRGLVSFISVARVLGKFSYNAQSLAEADPFLVTREVLHDSWRIISSVLANEPVHQPERHPAFTFACCEAAAAEFGIEHIQAVSVAFTLNAARKAVEAQGPGFLAKLQAAFPPGKRDRNVLNQVATALACDLELVQAGLYVARYERRKAAKEAARKSKELARQTDLGETNGPLT